MISLKGSVHHLFSSKTHLRWRTRGCAGKGRTSCARSPVYRCGRHHWAQTVEAEREGPRNRPALFLAGWKHLSLLISLYEGSMA